MTGIDFSLASLGTAISGTAVDALTDDATPSRIQLFDSNGIRLEVSDFNPFEFSDVYPGTYYLRTAQTPDFLDQVYGGDRCDPECDPISGTPIVIGLGDVASGVEIPLAMGPGLRGLVLDGNLGSPLAGVSIDLWDQDGNHVDSAVTDSSGWYRLPTEAGWYYVSTDNDLGFDDLVYNGILCTEGSAWEGLCDPTEGSLYDVEEYQPLQRLDFTFGDEAVFSDGFESGDTTAWSVTVGD